MNRVRLVMVVIVLMVLAVALTGAFLTRGVMAYLPFLQARKGDWTGRVCSARRCGSTALADRRCPRGSGTVG